MDHGLELPDGWEPILDADGRVVGGRGPVVNLADLFPDLADLFPDEEGEL